MLQSLYCGEFNAPKPPLWRVSSSNMLITNVHLRPQTFIKNQHTDIGIRVRVLADIVGSHGLRW